jgi:hypothetical protein
MRTKLFSKILFSCAAVAALTIGSTPAMADEITASPSGGSVVAADHSVVATPAAVSKPNCSGLTVLGYQGDYPRQDVGNLAAVDSVTQSMAAVTCGHFTLDWWVSHNLPGHADENRTLLNRAGNEHDLELDYHNRLRLPLAGNLNYDLYGAWYFLNLGKGLGNLDDDIIEFYVEGSKVYQYKGWTGGPFVRYTRLQPTSSYLQSVDLMRFGLRLDSPRIKMPLVGPLTFHAEVAQSTGLNQRGVIPYQTVSRGEFWATKHIVGCFSLGGGFKATEHTGLTPVAKVTCAIEKF